MENNVIIQQQHEIQLLRKDREALEAALKEALAAKDCEARTGHDTVWPLAFPDEQWKWSTYQDMADSAAHSASQCASAKRQTPQRDTNREQLVHFRAKCLKATHRTYNVRTAALQDARDSLEAFEKFLACENDASQYDSTLCESAFHAAFILGQDTYWSHVFGADFFRVLKALENFRILFLKNPEVDWLGQCVSRLNGYREGDLNKAFGFEHWGSKVENARHEAVAQFEKHGIPAQLFGQVDPHVGPFDVMQPTCIAALAHAVDSSAAKVNQSDALLTSDVTQDHVGSDKTHSPPTNILGSVVPQENVVYSVDQTMQQRQNYGVPAVPSDPDSRNKQTFGYDGMLLSTYTAPFHPNLYSQAAFLVDAEHGYLPTEPDTLFPTYLSPQNYNRAPTILSFAAGHAFQPGLPDPRGSQQCLLTSNGSYLGQHALTGAMDLGDTVSFSSDYTDLTMYDGANRRVHT